MKEFKECIICGTPTQFELNFEPLCEDCLYRITTGDNSDIHEKVQKFKPKVNKKRKEN